MPHNESFTKVVVTVGITEVNIQILNVVERSSECLYLYAVNKNDLIKKREYYNNECIFLKWEYTNI